MRVLICEDEPRLRQFLEDAIRAENWPVMSCSQRQELEALLSPDEHQILILDRRVGREDLLDHLPRFKQVAPKSRILFLSAIDNPQEKAQALDLGADDYLSKPFSLIELLARIRKLLKSTDDVASSLFLNQANVKLEPLSHRVWVDGKLLPLSNKEYWLLYHLMKHPGRIYNRYQLLDLVWPNQLEIESNVVEVTLKNLRKKLQGAGARLKISSQRGLGYWLEE